MFLDGASPLIRILIVGPLAYLALVLLLRLSGKRTLSNFNAFDFVITIAIGSTFATILLNRTVALLDGVLALALLVALQYIVTWLSVRLPRFDRLVKSRPTLLLHEGRLLHGALRRERVTEDEILAVARETGLESLAQVRSAVLESAGAISITPK